MNRPRPATSAILTISTIVAATNARLLVLLSVSAFVMLFLGVILPAVWFADGYRRHDARAVLHQLLSLVRQSRSP